MSASRFQSSVRAPEKSLPLFDRISSINSRPGSMNDDLLVRGVVTASIKHSGLSREQIADAMSDLLGITVTARMLTAFTAESKELHRWPGAWDRAFCSATRNNDLLKCRAEAAGLLVIGADEIKLLELGREYLRQKRASRSIAQLESDLEGVDL